MTDRPLDHTLKARLAAFQWIAGPLIAALTDLRDEAADGADTAADADRLKDLVASTLTVARTVAEKIGAADRGDNDWVRWSAAVTATHIVAAQYRATGETLSEGDVAWIGAAAADIAELASPAADAPDDAADADAATAARLKLIDAMTPVVGAVGRFAFGHEEEALIVDIARRLVETVASLVADLAGDQATADARGQLRQGLLQAAAELYAECHYAEMDRLLAMDPDALAAYGRAHDNRMPMEPVWQAFDLRLRMLGAVARHLDIPDDAVIADPKA